MLEKLVGIKNILWAIGIVLCLVLLFVGFIFRKEHLGQMLAKAPVIGRFFKR